MINKSGHFMKFKKIIPLFIGATALTISIAAINTRDAHPEAVFAYDGLEAPSITAHLDIDSALVFERDSEQTSINVEDMIAYDIDNAFYTYSESNDVGMVSEVTGNKKYHASLIPVTFSMHLGSREQVTFSELDIQITAYKTTSTGSAACVTELLSDKPAVINGANNNTASAYSLARCYTAGTTPAKADYHLGNYTFVNESDEEADIYLPETYYFVTIVRWASRYDHLGVGLVGIGNKYCTDVRGIDDKDIQIEFDNENTVYYRQQGSDLASVAYNDMSPVVFNDSSNDIFDASINDRLAVVQEKSMNRYFNVILIPFRFYVNLDAYERVTISEFNINLTIRKVASGGIAGAFVELFNACPETITTTWNAASSPNYSVGRISTNAGSRNLESIHDRIAKSCSCDGFAFDNDSPNNQNIYTDYFYIAICGNYASSYDHLIEATMNVVPAEGDSVISYTRDVTLNGTNCEINGGLTANYQSPYNATIIPDEHYTYPTSIEVLMGGVLLTRNNQYTYNALTGQITINANVVSDDIVINAIAVPALYTATYLSGEGSGSNHIVNNLTYGPYLLIDFVDTNFKAPTGKKFKCWSIDDIEYEPGDEYIIGNNINITAIYEDIPVTDYLENAVSFATINGTEVVNDGVLSVNNVYIRFCASIPVVDWENIDTQYEITDYGVMLVRKNTLINTYGASGVEEAFRNGNALTIGHKGSGIPPVTGEEDIYAFNVKLNVSTYDLLFVAAPFIVANDEYYFLDEMEYSVNTLAAYYLTNGGSNLSNEALTLLAAPQGE